MNANRMTPHVGRRPERVMTRSQMEQVAHATALRDAPGLKWPGATTTCPARPMGDLDRTEMVAHSRWQALAYHAVMLPPGDRLHDTVQRRLARAAIRWMAPEMAPEMEHGATERGGAA